MDRARMLYLLVVGLAMAAMAVPQSTDSSEAPLASDGHAIAIVATNTASVWPPSPGDGQSTHSILGQPWMAEIESHFQSHFDIHSHAGPIDGAAPMASVTSDSFPTRAIVVVVVPSLPEQCSGFLYGPSIVATAGHCVSAGNGGPWANTASIRIYAGFDGVQSEKFGSCGATRLYSTRGWVENGDERYDYGAIQLDCHVGDHAGWLGLTPATTSYVGVDIEVRGYHHTNDLHPCEANLGNRLRPCSGPGAVRADEDGQLFYFNNTFAGMSGSPVVTPSACGACAIGIHTMDHHGNTGVHAQFNHGTLFTSPRLANLRAWRDMP